MPSTAFSVGRPGRRPPWPAVKCWATSRVSMIGTRSGARRRRRGLASREHHWLRAHVAAQREAACVGAAVDIEDRAGDVAGLRRCQEQHRAGDVPRVAGLAKRDGADQRRAQVVGRAVGIGVAPAAHVDVAGGDHVDPDPVRRRVPSRTPCSWSPAPPSTRCRRRLPAWAARRAGRDADHGGTAGAAGHAVPRERLGHHEGAGDVDARRRDPRRPARHVEQRAVRDRLAASLTRMSAWPEPAGRGRDHLARPASGRPMSPMTVTTRGWPAKYPESARSQTTTGAPSLGEALGDGAADAVGAAGDDRRPAVEACCGAVPSGRACCAVPRGVRAVRCRRGCASGGTLVLPGARDLPVGRRCSLSPIVDCRLKLV